MTIINNKVNDDCKRSENYNDMYKNVVLENKVTNDKNDIENGNVIEKVVSESHTLKSVSEIVSESERVMGCKRVEVDVDQIEREYEESEQVEGWQRVNFFWGVKGGEERSSRVYWVEKCSTNNCFLNFFVVPGESRKCFNVAVPSAWSERENVIWCYGERDLDRELCIDREIELYKLKRNYNELKEMLEVVKRNDMKYLPCRVAVSYTHLDVYKRQVSDIRVRGGR